jgi:hypothetical protein
MSSEDGRPDLSPARPDAEGSEGRPSYMPRVPWRWILLGAVVLMAVVGSYYVRRQQRGDALRADMLRVHRERLGAPSRQYMAFRERLEGLVVEAARAEAPERWVDPRLDFTELRTRPGLYLRLPVEAAREPEQLQRAARGTSPDAIMRCLGVSATHVGGLYDAGYFLTPEWVEALRREQDLMRLRVLEEQLRGHVQADTPVVFDLMRAEWFMLVLQRGENRRDHPVDVYLWDLRRNRALLRARVQSRGLLIPVRLRLEGQPQAGPAARRDLTSGGANDCSIAAQIRELAGTRAVEFGAGSTLVGAENSPPVPPPPMPEAPASQPPASQPPATQPPASQPPATQPPR